MRRIQGFVALAAVAAASSARAVQVQSGPDFEMNVNLLLQVRAEGTFQGSVDRQFDTDFFLRRARLMAAGTAYKSLLFLIQLDNSNLGKRGNLAPGAFVQDLVVGWTPFEDLIVEGGFLVMPTTRTGGASGSAGQLAVEAPTDLLLMNADKGFRENGIQLRGFLADKRIHYRAGIWEGLHSTPATAGTPAINPDGRPLVGGHMRLNLVGEETGYSFNEMYLDSKRRASLGASIQYQPQAACFGTTCSVNDAGRVNSYAMYAADSFVDWPFPGDQEFAADAALYRWDYGDGFLRTGWAYAGTIGYRVRSIGFAASGYQFKADAGATNRSADRRKLAATLDWFIKGNLSKIQLEVNSITPGSTGPSSIAPTANPGGLASAPSTKAIWLQMQSSF